MPKCKYCKNIRFFKYGFRIITCEWCGHQFKRTYEEPEEVYFKDIKEMLE